MEYANTRTFLPFPRLPFELRAAIWKPAASQLRLAPVWLSLNTPTLEDWSSSELERLADATDEIEPARRMVTSTAEYHTRQETRPARTSIHGSGSKYQINSTIDPLLLACKESRTMVLEGASWGNLMTCEDPISAVTFNYERDILMLHSKYQLQPCRQYRQCDSMYILRILNSDTLSRVKHVAIELVAAHEHLKLSRLDECRRRIEELVTLLYNVESIGLIDSRSIINGTSPDKLVFLEVIDLQASIARYNEYVDRPATAKCPDAVPLRKVWPPSSWEGNEQGLISSLNYHRETHSNSKTTIKKLYWRMLMPEHEALSFRMLQLRALTASSSHQLVLARPFDSGGR